MVYCPECHAEIEIEEASLDADEVIECAPCGVLLEVVGSAPLELEAFDSEKDEPLDQVED